jgi:hypothetical protein
MSNHPPADARLLVRASAPQRPRPALLGQGDPQLAARDAAAVRPRLLELRPLATQISQMPLVFFLHPLQHPEHNVVRPHQALRTTDTLRDHSRCVRSWRSSKARQWAAPIAMSVWSNGDPHQGDRPGIAI